MMLSIVTIERVNKNNGDDEEADVMALSLLSPKIEEPALFCRLYKWPHAMIHPC